MKTASALFTLVAVGASLAAASPARADVASTISCDKSLDCTSKGLASLRAESREAIMSSIGTGWIPECPNGQAHCSDENIQVAVSMDLAPFPAPSTEPLWSIDMKGASLIQASWPTPKEFELTAPASSTSDGIFNVTHTLIPSMKVYAALGPFKKEWAYDASKFITDNAANFNYRATNTVMFAPWGLEQDVFNLVPAPQANTVALFETKLVNDDNFQMNVGLSAQSSPKFTYRTTKVALTGASAIAKDSLVGKLPMTDADYLDLMADVEGELVVEGELIAAPYVAITRIGNLNIPGGLVLDYTGSGAPKKAYKNEYPVAVKFPQVKVHIALPNVKVPKSLDISTTQVGKATEQTVTIPNTGELAAKMKVESSDPQFTVDAPSGIDAKGNASMKVRFSPSKEGPQEATITVRSTDPDAPVQTMTVKAQASAVPVPPAAEPAPVAAAPLADSGCGCRTTPAPTSPLAALAGLGLALGLVARRRRSA